MSTSERQPSKGQSSKPFTVRAPGRVNLIGGHVDFHEGPVICCAVDRAIEIEVHPTAESVIRLESAGFDDAVVIPLGAATMRSAATQPEWGRLVEAMIKLADRYGVTVAGFDAHVRSDLAIGGGLSSSAAFEVGCAVALLARVAATMEPTLIARWAQEAEHLATGVPCGIQDQMASVLGGLVLLDCRDLSVRTLRIPDGVSIVVIDSGQSRTLEGSPWAARRAESFDDARAIGVDVLRDATVGMVGARPRARHVVEEIARVWSAAEALDAGDVEQLGNLMSQSHQSSRVLWESSTPELDVIVEEAVAAGAFGARLTGGGFGGCAVALCPTDESERICAAITERASQRNGQSVTAGVRQIASGATVI